MQTAKTRWPALLIQSSVGLLLLGLLGYLVHNTALNLQARGIASGFDFLSRPAGFDIAFSLWPFDERSTFLDAFWAGVCNTLLVSALGIGGASLLGLLVALMRLSQNPLLRTLAGFYIESLRNIPLLLQLFFWYFVVLRELPIARESWQLGPIFLNNRGLYFPFPAESTTVWQLFVALLIGLLCGHFLHARSKRLRREKGHYPRWWIVPFILPLALPIALIFWLGPHADLSYPELKGFNFGGGLQLIPELLAMVVALSLYTAAFIGEIIRAGIMSLPQGQREAAAALGLSTSDSLLLVILPQALRVIIPPLISQYLNLMKNSSLSAAIAFPDLVLIFAGTALNVTGQAVEIMGMTMLVYLILSLSLATLLNLYQRSILKWEQR